MKKAIAQIKLAFADPILGLIVGVALALRLWGIGFGLPYEYHVDEVQYVRQAASMGSRGLEPVWWNNPPALKYVLLAEYGGLFVFGKALGWYASAADFGAKSSIDPTLLYLLGRGTSAVLGTLTVLATYWLARFAYSRRVGLMAAWFLAVCFLAVRESHYATNDAAVTLLVTLVLYGAVRITRTSQKRWYVVSGIALGLGFATKYSAIFAIIPLLAAHFCSPCIRRRSLAGLRPGYLGLALLAAAFAAVVASPYFVITPAKVINDAYNALVLAGQSGFDGWQIDSGSGYVFYLKSLAWGLGWGLLIMSIAGIFVAIIKRSAASFVLLSFLLPIYLIMGRQLLFFARFALPLLPAMLILAALALDVIAVRFVKNERTRLVALIGATLLVTVQPLVASLRSDYLLLQTDTRTLSMQWIEDNLPGGAAIAVDWPTHGPPLATSDTPRPDSRRTYAVTVVGQSGLAEHSLEWYQQQGFDYLISSSFISNIPLLDAKQDAHRREFYQLLEQNLKLVAEFSPATNGEEPPFVFDEIYGPAISLWQRERPGPTIKIYQLASR